MGKDEIETKEGRPKYTDSDERVQKEIKRTKIVNNRENMWDVKLTDTHFVRERESRYEKWKNQMERNGYRRSDSRKGYWKNGAAASVNRYVKDRNGSRFRSQSNGAGFNSHFSQSGG